MSTSLGYLRLLRSKTRDGKPYLRFPETETEIAEMLCLSEYRRMALAPHCRPETLVYLIRDLRGRKKKILGVYAAELSKWIARIAPAFVRGYSTVARDEILWSFEKRIFDLVLADPPTRQSEYLEIAFGKAVERFTINAVKSYESAPWRKPGCAPTVLIDDEGEEIEGAGEDVADERDGPEESLLQKEDQATKARWYRKAMRAITNPLHREVARLHWCDGTPVQSSDPREPDIVHTLNITVGQAEHALHTAKGRCVGRSAPTWKEEPNEHQRYVFR
jgi:hypothetical protein